MPARSKSEATGKPAKKPASTGEAGPRQPRAPVPRGGANPPALPATVPPAVQDAKLAADTALHPECTAAMTLERIWAATRPMLLANPVEEPGQVQGPVDAQALCDRLAEEVRSVHNGNLAGAEAKLTSQSATLDGLFAKLSQLALGSFAIGKFSEFDTLMRLALRSQNQCRATLETLALMENPHHAIFARQANVTSGPQQVVNHASSASDKTEGTGQ